MEAIKAEWIRMKTIEQKIKSIASAYVLAILAIANVPAAIAVELDDVYACDTKSGKKEYRNEGNLTDCKKLTLKKDESNLINVMQFKDGSCGDWDKMKNNPMAEQSYHFWFRGFVSGYNYAAPKNQISVDDFPNKNAVFLYVDKYCRKNPFAQFSAAAFSLIDELPKKGKSP